jgi:hypothetical protein
MAWASKVAGASQSSESGSPSTDTPSRSSDWVGVQELNLEAEARRVQYSGNR